MVLNSFLFCSPCSYFFLTYMFWLFQFSVLECSILLVYYVLHSCFVPSFTLALFHSSLLLCSILHSCFVSSFNLALFHPSLLLSSILHSCFVPSFTLLFVPSFTLPYGPFFTHPFVPFIVFTLFYPLFLILFLFCSPCSCCFLSYMFLLFQFSVLECSILLEYSILHSCFVPFTLPLVPFFSIHLFPPLYNLSCLQSSISPSFVFS